MFFFDNSINITNIQYKSTIENINSFIIFVADQHIYKDSDERITVSFSLQILIVHK